MAHDERISYSLPCLLPLTLIHEQPFPHFIDPYSRVLILVLCWPLSIMWRPMLVATTTQWKSVGSCLDPIAIVALIAAYPTYGHFISFVADDERVSYISP